MKFWLNTPFFNLNELRLFSDDAGEGNSDCHGSSGEESSSSEYNSKEDSAGSLINFIVDLSSCRDSEDAASQLPKDQCYTFN